ncbi:MAG: hypothetical protein PHV33_07495 [Elusimicrobiales bacterium]|nr:hypothetical protein [Elusimicrobiales bacterium]
MGSDITRNNLLFFGAWAYVFLADHLTYRKSGASLLVSNAAEVFALALGSMAIMSLFEILNYRFEVWRYIHGPFLPLKRWTGLALCWASILPSVILTSELLLAYGYPKNLTLKRFKVPGWFLILLSVSGAGMLALALAAPGRFWPLGFIGLVCLSEPVNYRLGLGSLLRDLSWGAAAKTVRLAVSGGICGLLWRGFNTFSGTQLVYFSEGDRLTGISAWVLLTLFVFPFLAIEGYSLYSLASVFRGGRTWEKGVWAYRGKPPGPRYKWVAIILTVLVCSIALGLADRNLSY